MVWEDLKPRDILTRKSFENAITVLMAVGGSTNALVHLIAMAGRAGVPLALDDFDVFSRRTPLICNLRPSGKYLMEDFYYAGGLPALLGELRELLHLERAHRQRPARWARTSPGPSVYNTDVIRSVGDGAVARGRAGGAAREPGPQRRGHQDQRLRAAAC